MIIRLFYEGGTLINTGPESGLPAKSLFLYSKNLLPKHRYFLRLKILEGGGRFKIQFRTYVLLYTRTFLEVDNYNKKNEKKEGCLNHYSYSSIDIS